jgi:hypothetical protein
MLPAAVDLSEVPLRELLAEVSRRAIPLCPSGQLTCACGETFASADQLDLHFYDVFLPADDIGTDGRLHTEIWAASYLAFP